MALTDDIVRNNPQSPAIIHLFARDGFTWKKGSIIAHRAGSCLAEVPLSGSPRSDLIVRGVAMAAGTSVGAGDGVVAIAIDPGYQGDFETGAGGNEITADNVDEICYAYDDNTLYLTDATGTLSPAGRVKYVDEDGRVTVFFDQNPVDYILAGEGTVADLEARLAATTNGDGASMIGVEDAGGYTAETDVEGALQELYPLVLAGMTASKKTLTANHDGSGGAQHINAAAATQTINIDTALPANSRIVGVDIHTLTPFSGGTVGDFTVDIGTSGDVDALIDGADLFAAAVDGGPATIPQGIRPNKFFAAGGQLIATFRCGSDDVGDATAGAVTIDVLYVVLA